MNVTDTMDYRLKAFKASSIFTPGDPLSFNIVFNEECGLPGKFDAGEYIRNLGADAAMLDKNVLVVCPGNGGLCVEALKSGASTVVALEPRSLYDKALSAVSDFTSEVVGATFSRRAAEFAIVEKFDVVLWSEGLDEVVHPKTLFEAVVESLTADGRLFIEVAHGHHKKLPESINSWRPSKDAFLETLKDYPLQIDAELEGRDQVRTIYALRYSGPRVIGLPGSDASDAADMEYFRRKLGNVTKAPDGYLENTTNEESAEEFASQIQAEIEKNRQDVAAKMGPFVSKEFVQKKILNLSDEEIQESQKLDNAHALKAAQRLAEKIKGLIPTDKPVEDSLDSVYEGRELTPKSKKGRRNKNQS